MKNKAVKVQFQTQFHELLIQGKKLFSNFKNQKGTKGDLTETEAYTLIKCD